MKPTIFDLNKPGDKAKLAKLKKQIHGLREVSSDTFLTEITKVRNPHIKDTEVLKELRKKIQESVSPGLVVYLPWKMCICHVPSKKIYFELTTARNRQLINENEQNKLRKTVVAFFGMSVGSQAALVWMMESRADVIKIADFDTVDVSNLNRIRFGVDALGRYKTEIVTEGLYEINPFTDVLAFRESSNKESIQKILTGNPKVDVIIDGIDDMESKIYLRKFARKLKIPLVSAADVGDNIQLDIERCDLSPAPEIFLGAVPGIKNLNFEKMGELDRKKLIIDLVGFESESKAMLDSLMAIGGSITTWPQLGATATIASGVVTTTLKKILLGEKIKSGRYRISLDEMIVDDYLSKEQINIRNKKIKQLIDLLSK